VAGERATDEHQARRGVFEEVFSGDHLAGLRWESEMHFARPQLANPYHPLHCGIGAHQERDS
jgi:hypothetical protein